MHCIRCGSEATRNDGQTRLGGQRWRCNGSGRCFTARSPRACLHHAFPDEVIAVAVRHSVRYRLSSADVVAWFAQRGLVVAPSTVYRWVHRFVPLFGQAARVHRRPVGATWRVDAWDVRVHGRWTYVERAINEDGQVVAAYFSERRNAKAAHTFFQDAIEETGVTPARVTTDTAPWYPPARRTAVPPPSSVPRRTSTMAWSATRDI
jgi:transposase-like protein